MAFLQAFVACVLFAPALAGWRPSCGQADLPCCRNSRCASGTTCLGAAERNPGVCFATNICGGSGLPCCSSGRGGPSVVNACGEGLQCSTLTSPPTCRTPITGILGVGTNQPGFPSTSTISTALINGQALTSIGSGSSSTQAAATVDNSKLNGGTSAGSTLQQAQVQGNGPGAGVLQTETVNDVRGPDRQSTSTVGGNTAFLAAGDGTTSGTAYQAASSSADKNGGSGIFQGNSGVVSDGPAGTSVSFDLGQQNVH